MRKEPTLRAKLAAALRELSQIDYEHAKAMSDDQLISLFEFHHIHLHAQNKHEPWVDEHWNLQPMLRFEHRDRTAKLDVPQFYKTERIRKEHEDFRRTLLTPRDERKPKQSSWGKKEKTKWPTRKFGKSPSRRT